MKTNNRHRILFFFFNTLEHTFGTCNIYKYVALRFEIIGFDTEIQTQICSRNKVFITSEQQTHKTCGIAVHPHGSPLLESPLYKNQSCVDTAIKPETLHCIEKSNAQPVRNPLCSLEYGLKKPTI